ncbi:hypothetical protein HD806DRAFT_519183 [Xylariaceae sp. AK1471]|nr:hypothetical protein HD806DRAFT_519183 [Xylariaceae sp. AK1471]
MYLRQSQLDDLVGEIGSGATLGQLRRKIASALEPSLFPDALGTIEPDQVIIEALGGLHPGPVQGDHWECKNIRSWLCRHLRISLVRSEDYFVFQGFNERYVLHSPQLDLHGTIIGYRLKTWLRREVLTTVRQQVDYLEGIKVDDISLFHRGKLVKDSTHFRPGKSLDFELSRSAGDIFVREEAWLLPQTETCSICADDKRVSEFPNRRTITSDCAHEATACKACVSQWITSSMETVAWDRLKCPECPKMLGFKDVEAFATRDVFLKYDKLATKAMLDNVQGFRWCLNPRCDAGQIYPLECTKAKCYSCKHYSCVRHDIPWHSSETCEEYDKRTRKQRKNNKLSEKHVKEITKPCPGCKKNVNKYSGCDHITCVCGHEWCWLCFGTYTRDNDSFLQCKHTRQCRYRTAPPFWEGGRALMPFMGPAGRPPRPPGGRPFPLPLRPQGIPAAAANRPGQNRPEPPQMPLPGLPADLIDFIFGGEQNGQDPRPRQAQHGIPFINDALLFDLAQLMHRAL